MKQYVDEEWDDGDLKIYQAKSAESQVGGGGLGGGGGGGGGKGPKNKSCSECPETHFGLGILKSHRILKIKKFL